MKRNLKNNSGQKYVSLNPSFAPQIWDDFPNHGENIFTPSKKEGTKSILMRGNAQKFGRLTSMYGQTSGKSDWFSGELKLIWKSLTAGSIGVVRKILFFKFGTESSQNTTIIIIMFREIIGGKRGKNPDKKYVRIDARIFHLMKVLWVHFCAFVVEIWRLYHVFIPWLWGGKTVFENWVFRVGYEELIFSMHRVS